MNEKLLYMQGGLYMWDEGPQCRLKRILGPGGGSGSSKIYVAVHAWLQVRAAHQETAAAHMR